MDIHFKLLKPDGTDSETTLSGLAKDTTLETIRTMLGSFISETDFFVFANGNQVAKGSESSIEVSFNMIDDRTPNQILLSQAADIVGVQTEWIDDAGLSINVKLNDYNPEAIQQNADKSPAILLKKVNENSPNIADIANAVILESDSAIEIRVASKGTYGFVLKGSDGAESLFHTYGLNPDGDNEEKFVTMYTYLNVDTEMNIKKDLIVIEDGKSEALHMSGKEVGRRWEISIKVWELEGYQTFNHDTNETVNYGSIQ